MNADETFLLEEILQTFSDLKRNVVDIDGLPFALNEHVWVKRVHTYDEFILVRVESELAGLSDLHSPILLDPRTVIRKSPHAIFKAPNLVPTGRLVWIKSAAEGGNDFTYVCGRLIIRTGKLWFQPLDFNKVFDEARWVSKMESISTSPVHLSQVENGLHWTVDAVRGEVMVVSTTSDGPIEFLGSFDDFLISRFAKQLPECAAVVAYF